MLLLWLFKSNNYILSVAQPWIPLYFCSWWGVCSANYPTNICGVIWLVAGGLRTLLKDFIYFSKGFDKYILILIFVIEYLRYKIDLLGYK